MYASLSLNDIIVIASVTTLSIYCNNKSQYDNKKQHKREFWYFSFVFLNDLVQYSSLQSYKKI
jgi:hypothetical protein